MIKLSRNAWWFFGVYILTLSLALLIYNDTLSTILVMFGALAGLGMSQAQIRGHT